MRTQKVNEDSFFEFHEFLKDSGYTILRCVEIAKKGSKDYIITFMDKK